MTDYRILTAADALAIPADFDCSHWNVGRSGDLGQGVEVWTSWLPVQGIFETLINVPLHLKEQFYATFRHDTYTTHSSEDALAVHRQTVAEVATWLAGVGA